MNKTVDILGIPVHQVTMDEAVMCISEFVNSSEMHCVFTPNPEIIMLAQENEDLKRTLKNADLVVPDGIGVVIASKLLKGEPLPERVAGFDLVQNTMKEAAYKGYRYYFLGSKPGIAEKAAENMRQNYPGIQIVGYRDGYFKEEETPDIIEEINESNANILLVALGAPKQELWIEKHKASFKYIKVAIGVGGSLDVMAGAVKRAPEFYQKLKLEWFYRLISQPSRAGRMLLLPQFVLKVIRKRYKKDEKI